MERLARLAHRVIWVNPRSASDGFRAPGGGIAAALPFVDDLVSGHSLSALDDLLAAIAERRCDARPRSRLPHPRSWRGRCFGVDNCSGRRAVRPRATRPGFVSARADTRRMDRDVRGHCSDALFLDERDGIHCAGFTVFALGYLAVWTMVGMAR